MNYEQELSGGHPNSLGNTIAVVDEILKDRSKLERLYQTYFSNDEVVRLRVSNGIRRICVEKPEWIVPYIDKLLNEISQIDQASTQWTLSKLYQMLESYMDHAQKTRATKLMKDNIKNHKDWIVLNNTMETLSEWSADDHRLATWLKPELERLRKDSRKSVAARATKYLNKM